MTLPADRPAYEARQLPDGRWAVFLGNEQLTRSGTGEVPARGWANLMNRTARK